MLEPVCKPMFFLILDDDGTGSRDGAKFSRPSPQAGSGISISQTHGLRPPMRTNLNGGACRDRTDDPLLAKQMLSQLS